MSGKGLIVASQGTRWLAPDSTVYVVVVVVVVIINNNNNNSNNVIIGEGVEKEKPGVVYSYYVMEKLGHEDC